MFTPRFGWILAGCCLLATSSVQADTVYKWIDDDGRVNYGNVPPKGVKALPINAEISVLPSLAPPPPKVQASDPVVVVKSRSKPLAAEDVAPKPPASAPAKTAERPPEKPRKQVDPCEPGVDCGGKPPPLPPSASEQ